MGGNGMEKKQSPHISLTLFFSSAEKNRVKEMWGLFFFTAFLPHVWDSVFFRAPKLASALLFLPSTFQDQGSGYSLRGA